MAFRTKLYKGESISIACEVVMGVDELVGATARSELKKAAKGGGVPSENAPVVLVLTTEYRAELDIGLGPGWLITGSTATLAPGEYVTDVRITLADGYVDYADPVIVEVLARVTS